MILAVIFFGIEIFFYFFERKIGEVINPGPGLKVWLKIHLLNFSYIGLLHMSLIFFVSRWSNPGPYSTYLPAEHIKEHYRRLADFKGISKEEFKSRIKAPSGS